jgi:galactokinase
MPESSFGRRGALVIVSELLHSTSEALARAGDDSVREGGPDAFPALPEAASSPDAATRGLVESLRLAYGPGRSTVEGRLRTIASLAERFLGLYGDGPVALLRAPARINVLGEHVDYVSYLPTASLTFGSREHEMLMLYRPAPGGRVRGASTAEGYPPFDFSLADAPPAAEGAAEAAWLEYLFGSAAPAPHWGNYVKGAVYFARLKYGARVAAGFDFAVDSGMPPSGGASSSSALVVLASAAAREANRIGYAPAELAADASRAEWYVGTRGGTMDHITICLAEGGRALLISYGEGRTRAVPLPGSGLRWVTFFSHAADKGREVMLEYNERAAVSRILIPAALEALRRDRPGVAAAWDGALAQLVAGSAGAFEALATSIAELPEELSLEDCARRYPAAYAECERAFPALVADRRGAPLKMRARALHHLGEVRRVGVAARALETNAEDAARVLGGLLDESHASLRDLYGVSTPEVERLVAAARSAPGVLGARLMGGGFGGNVLALAEADAVAALVDRVQAEYYASRGRDGLAEGSVMISTPGEGLSRLGPREAWRQELERFNALGPGASGRRAAVAAALDRLPIDVRPDDVWPVVVAAGKGSRARETGLDVPKPLAPVSGVPAIVRVLRNLAEAVGGARPPIVIVSPDTERAIRGALSGANVTFVVQPDALGTGDAVLCARDLMQGFAGRALVVWGTQPALRPVTMRRTLKLAALFDEYDLVLPTALKEHPYAPLERGERGRVLASRETHLEKAELPAFGETNVGLFAPRCSAMFEALVDLHRRHWNASEGRYDKPGGELGFPNEVINHLAGRPAGVFACPVADPREGQGIKELDDVARCERIIAELQ